MQVGLKVRFYKRHDPVRESIAFCQSHVRQVKLKGAACIDEEGEKWNHRTFLRRGKKD